MTRRQFSTAALALLPGSLRGETQQERANRVIKQTIQALGGDAFRQMPGRVETGRAFSFYEDKVAGLSPAKIYTKYLPEDSDKDRPLREVQRGVYGKKEEEAVILTPPDGWDVTYRGAQPLPAERIAQFVETVRYDTLYILRARLDEPNVSFDSRGSDVVENQPVEVLDFYDAENRNVRMWIHSSTRLPVRQLVKRWDPLIKDRREEITRYTKYRDAGNGVMWPFAIQRERDGEKTSQLFSDSVKVGPLEDSLFKLPPGVVMLKKT
jgi:hypothetical protein